MKRGSPPVCTLVRQPHPTTFYNLGVGFCPPAGCPGLNVGEPCCHARDGVRHGCCFACAAGGEVTHSRR